MKKWTVIGIVLIIAATPFIFTPLYVKVANLVLTPTVTNYTSMNDASGIHLEIPLQDSIYFPNPPSIYPAYQNYTINIIMEAGDTVDIYLITENQFDYWYYYENPNPPSSYVGYYLNINNFTYTWFGDIMYVVFWNGDNDSAVYVDSIKLYGTNLVATATSMDQVRETASNVAGWVLFSIGTSILVIILVVVGLAKLKKFTQLQSKTERTEK